MERAARVLGKLQFADDETLAQAAWPLAVGEKIASRTGAVALFDSRLVVNVSDSVWQSQLWSMRGQIMQRLEQVLGRKIVTEIEFRLAVPRPRAQREERSAASADEADGIRNPVLRTIYKDSRNRSKA